MRSIGKTISPVFQNFENLNIGLIFSLDGRGAPSQKGLSQIGNPKASTHARSFGASRLKTATSAYE